MTINEINQFEIIESISYSAGTDVGMKREENQDSYGILLGDTYRLFFVADGMGGVQGGSIASNLALASIEKTLRDQSRLNISQVVSAVKEANKQIYNKGNSDPNLTGMGTTIVGLMLSETGAYYLHVGDSRAYLIRNKSITRLTEDHTLVQELVRSGAISEDQAEHHPVAHMLTRSLGPNENIEVEFHTLSSGVNSRDKFLLCSDGLYNLVSESEILEIVSNQSTDDAVQMLIDLSNERGGSDNITIIIIDSQKYSFQSETLDEVEEQNLKSVTEEITKLNYDDGYHKTEIIQTAEAIISEQVTEDAISENDSSNSIINDDLRDDIDYIDNQFSNTSNISAFRKVGLIALSFISGIFFSYLIFARNNSSSDNNFEISNSNIPTREIPLEVIEKIDSNNLNLPKDNDHIASQVITQPRIGPAERTSIKKRKNDLELILQDLSSKISLISNSNLSQIQNLENQLKTKAEDLKSRIDQLRSDIDVATRKLALWYDRKQKLDSVDLVKMASELAPSNSSIKQKQDEFSKATWDYLNAVEALPYSNTDSTLREEKMASLVEKRSQKMKELGELVRETVKQSLEDADDAVAKLTIQRSSLEKDLESVRAELEFVRITLNSTSEEKDKLILNYKNKQDTVNLELIELAKLLSN